MKYVMLFLVGVVVCSLAWAGIPPVHELVGGENTEITLVKGCNSWSCALPCKNVYPKVQAALGKSADCMMKLFFKESTCNTHGPQKKGTAGNPHAGFGLCTIESSAGLRAKRGPNCIAASPSNVRAQILCCRDMMKATGKSGSYFGPIRRGEVPKCF